MKVGELYVNGLEWRALMEFIEEILEPVLRHRLQGHPLRFKPRKGEAEIYCFQCDDTVADGDRTFIEALYECVLQHPSVPRCFAKK